MSHLERLRETILEGVFRSLFGLGSGRFRDETRPKTQTIPDQNGRGLFDQQLEIFTNPVTGAQFWWATPLIGPRRFN